ncbi:unnamed protein product [Lota lota]
MKGPQLPAETHPHPPASRGPGRGAMGREVAGPEFRTWHSMGETGATWASRLKATPGARLGSGTCLQANYSAFTD